MTKLKHKALLIYSMLFLAVVLIAPVGVAFAGKTCGGGVDPKDNSQNKSVITSIDIGCSGNGNPITDMTYGIIKFLSAGVGLVIVGSVVVAGIQYSASGGDPQAAAKAKARISSTLIALLVFIFSYALLNYLIPGGFLNG